MQTLTVTGSLAERELSLLDVFNSGVARGLGSSLSIGSGGLMGVTVRGSGLSVTSSGDEFLDGTIRDFSLNQIVLGSSFTINEQLAVEVPEFGAGGLYTVTTREGNTVSATVNFDYLAEQLSGQDWVATGSEANDIIATTTLFSFAGTDTLNGLAGDDILIAGAGDDTIDGGTGFDTAVFGGTLSAYDFATPNNSNETITISGPDGTDTVTQIELLQFDDRFVYVDAERRLEDAQDIAALYEVTLDRNGAIDTPGLNFWYDVLEQGFSKSEIAQFFLDSPEFQENFGNVSALSDRDTVELFYLNTLDREGEEEGVNFWTGVLGRDNFDRADLLVAFSDSPENRTGLDILSDLREASVNEWDFVG